jgi:signal transduction histidine kinase
VRRDALANLRRLAAVGLACIAVGSVLLLLALRVTVAPLRAVASAARATGSRELDRSVLEPQGKDEISTLAREFNEMMTRLSEAAESRRQFLAAVSHELRTPLTIARGHREVFATQGDADAETIARTTHVLAGELRHMGRLVDDLMTLAHSDGQGFLRLTDVPLREVFEDLRLRLTGLDVDGITLQDDPPAVTLRADPDRLAQAVLNLVVNAQRHTPAGTVIEVSAQDADDVVIIEVADNGPGIDPTIRERMFEPFVTSGLHAGAKDTAFRPAGLGLAVVAAIIDAHHGTVAVDTGATGTTFGLRIPRAPASGEPTPH